VIATLQSQGLNKWWIPIDTMVPARCRLGPQESSNSGWYLLQGARPWRGEKAYPRKKNQETLCAEPTLLQPNMTY